MINNKGLRHKPRLVCGFSRLVGRLVLFSLSSGSNRVVYACGSAFRSFGPANKEQQLLAVGELASQRRRRVALTLVPMSFDCSFVLTLFHCWIFHCFLFDLMQFLM